MLISSNLFTVAKYGFVALIITGAGFLIATTTVLQHLERKSDNFTLSDLPSLPYKKSQNVLDYRYSHCLTSPSNPFCQMAFQERNELILKIKRDFQTDNDQTPPSSTDKTNKYSFADFLKDFSSVMTSLNVSVFLIEPSILFCLMRTDDKIRLLNDRYVPTRHLGYKNVVTFGIMEEDNRILDQNSTMIEVLSFGFKVSRSRRLYNPNAQKEYEDIFRTTHYFFDRKNFIGHLVVFFPTGTLFQHADLSPNNITNLLFNEESAYEKFTTMPLNTTLLPGLKVPFDPQFFLLQIETSQVVEFPPISTTPYKTAASVPDVTKKQLQLRASVAIEALKNRLRPEGVFFWIRSRSLLGWYLYKDIFSVSRQLYFAANFRNLKNLTIKNLFSSDDLLKLVRHFESEHKESGYELFINGVRINFLIVEGSKNSSWIAHEEQKRIVYPEFKLCSAVVLKHKITVPCLPEEILKIELGDKWTL